MPEAQIILQRLRKLAAKDNRPSALSAASARASALFTFVTRERERIAGCAFPRTSIVVIVEGSKELVTPGRQMRYAAGTVLVLPKGWRGDVVNDPDPKSGIYRAIFIDFQDELVNRARRSLPPQPNSARFDVALDPVLATAIHHAGEGIAAGTLPAVLAEHRLMEVLIVLGLRGALPEDTATLSDAVRALIRWQPNKPWTADQIAAELGTSNATLRRRLASESTSLRALSAEVRVELASALLSQDGLSLRDAALAAGYRSPRRFAERMRAELKGRQLADV
ncbi:helix-turn-helix domain-containing protein [Rhizobium mesoamericanum]|uniref:helix-turn-helix domain-containing protein n=1 Tax=Rhizobium mesoamericanum TaxID=1079800 RepID=UPI000415576F|nr:helix-turn-helix domain-containing protein [Rhizobium mesoamericanum]